MLLITVNLPCTFIGIAVWCPCHPSQTHYSNVISVEAHHEFLLSKSVSGSRFPPQHIDLWRLCGAWRRKSLYWWMENSLEHSQFWKEATRSLLLFVENQWLRLVEFLLPVNWLGLLLTCLCSLAVLRRTCVLDMIFISTGHWKRRGFSWERSVHFPLLSHGEIQQMSSRRRTRQKKESFFSSHYTFFPH